MMTDEQSKALLHALMAEVDAPADPKVDEAWLAEAERRDLEIESGFFQSIPAEDVFSEARTVLARGTRGGLYQTSCPCHDPRTAC